MIGVTLANKDYMPMAVEAAERFNKFTGLPFVIVRVNDKKPYMTKLRLHTMFNQTVVFFDADLWFVKKCDLSQFNERKEFIGVKDILETNDESSCIFINDCRKHGINRSLYINTGFYIWNNRHKQILEEASRLSEVLKVKDFGEQSYINIALQRSGCDILHLDRRYNNFKHFELDNQKRKEFTSFAIHGTGEAGAKSKMGYLKTQSKKYERKQKYGMHL